MPYGSPPLAFHRTNVTHSPHTSEPIIIHSRTNSITKPEPKKKIVVIFQVVVCALLITLLKDNPMNHLDRQAPTFRGYHTVRLFNRFRFHSPTNALRPSDFRPFRRCLSAPTLYGGSPPRPLFRHQLGTSATPKSAAPRLVGYILKVTTFPDSRAESVRLVIWCTIASSDFIFYSHRAHLPSSPGPFALRCTLLFPISSLYRSHSPSICFVRHFISISMINLLLIPLVTSSLIFSWRRGFYGILILLYLILLHSSSISSAFIIPNHVGPPHRLYRCFFSRPSVFSFRGSFIDS